MKKKYHTETPIWWYTYHCFLYPMLNTALRVMNGDVIVPMGFFIGDLHRHIKQLHVEQFGDHSSRKSFTVYRGQGLSTANFEKLPRTKGGLISFNNFLSTSKDCNVSLVFANDITTNPDLVGIFFIMKIDPTKSTTPFASIRDVSCFEGEDEVLFSMHSVFRIEKIKPMDGKNRLYEVSLTLISDNDPDLCILTNRIREESFPESEGWYRLGLLLSKMGELDKAQEVYEVLLGQTTNDSEKAPIYHQLGLNKYNQGEYLEALTFYEESLAIYQKTLPLKHPSSAYSYNNIGNVYYSMADYPKALSSHEKALAIQQQSLPPNDPSSAWSYNHIDAVYQSMGDYPKALSIMKKPLKFDNNHFLPMILVRHGPTTTSMLCIRAWVIIRKHFLL